jgi:hypothetical protein
MWYSNLGGKKKRYFRTYPPPTLIHLSLRFTSASKLAAQKSFVSATSAPGRASSATFERSWISRPLYTINTSYRKQGAFVYEYPLHWVHLPTINTQLCSPVVYSSTVAILTTETSLWTCTCASAILSWSWTLLLPSDTHRKLITSITAVLLQFVTDLLTLPRKLYEKSSTRVARLSKIC